MPTGYEAYGGAEIVQNGYGDSDKHCFFKLGDQACSDHRINQTLIRPDKEPTPNNYDVTIILMD